MVKHKTAFVVGSGAYAKLAQLKLQQTGFEVTCFPAGIDFTTNHLTAPVDLIILDQDQNELTNGIEYLCEIKTINREIPVLFLLSANDIHTATQALRFGAFFYIEKNFSFNAQLYYALQQLDLNKTGTYRSLLGSFRKVVFRLYGLY